MKIETDPKKISEILTRSIADILPSKEGLRTLLCSGQQLRLYIGADATGPALHLGHATNYQLLERLRKLGHKIFILIGDFTARIGDPTDRTATRKQLTRDEVKKNVKTWKKQLEPIIDFKTKNNPAEIVYNHTWLSKLTFEDVIELASNFTVQQMLERDMFQKRIKEEKPIYVHEFFYPLMQGYDSVMLDVDVEVCGTDQTFNALAGRTLMKKIKNKEKYVVTTTLLENPMTGIKMMSKSAGTGVFLTDTAANMYGKIMAQPDENMIQLFVDCTYVSLPEIEDIKNTLVTNALNPRDVKMRLAYEITRMYHGEKFAKKAEQDFVKVFQKRETPQHIPEKTLKVSANLLESLVLTGLAPSKSEARRLLQHNAVKLNNLKVNNPELRMHDGDEIRVGKRKWVKIHLA